MIEQADKNQWGLLKYNWTWANEYMEYYKMKIYVYTKY